MSPRQIVNYSALTLITAALAIAGYFYWQHQTLFPSTDDAYIQAQVIDIAAQVNGKVAQVFVQNQQKVGKNQLLFTIDPTPFQLAYNKAKANLLNAQQEMMASENAVGAAQARL